MAYTLQQLSDLEDIRMLKHRYFRSIDTASVAELEDMFTDDITVEYRGGTYLVKVSGRENMVQYLADSFNSDVVAMHHGHMPEIRLTGEDTAEGTWYLEDLFIDMRDRRRTIGSAIYRDTYRRENGSWKIASTEYERIVELNDTLPEDVNLDSHYLAKHGRKPEERGDISKMITWGEQPA